MKLTQVLTLAAFCAAPVAALSQSYGEKGWIGEVDAKSYVAADDHYVAPGKEARVYVEPVRAAPSETFGCVMGLGVMQRGTLICPGH